MALSRAVTCYEINHAGEGGRGQSARIERPDPSPRQCAIDAARIFHQREMNRDGWAIEEIGAFHDCVYYIEVADHPLEPGPVRYRVYTRVELTFEAIEGFE